MNVRPHFNNLILCMSTHTKISPRENKPLTLQLVYWSTIPVPGFHLVGGTGGKLTPQTLQLPPQKF